MKSQKKLELKKETIEILSQNSVRRIQGGCSKGDHGKKTNGRYMQ